jgi:hypothetical protein
MEDNKISSRPIVKKSAHEFILEAERQSKKKYKEEEDYKRQLPWQSAQVRQDVQKVFTVKLQEEYILKIKYISEQTNKSQQKIVREIISTTIDNMLKDLGY